MITDANGRPIVGDTLPGRSLVITEVLHQGKPSWAMDFKPNVQAFEFEEIIMILGDVTRAIAQQARQTIMNARAMRDVAEKMQKLKGE